MQYGIQILILFILIGNLLKLSFWKLWQTALFGLACAVFIIGMQQWAILQSKMQLTDLLNNTKIMQDAAVVITLESAIGFVFCFAEHRRLQWYPGLLAFPVLFYLQTQLIFAMPGSNFAVLSYTLAAVVFVAYPLLSRCLKWLCPEKELRMEIYFLVNLFICIIGLLTTGNEI